MPNLNRVLLMGHLGKDPEIRSTATGKKVGSFSLATTSGKGEQKSTEWHRVVCWDHSAEYASNYLKKGSPVYVEGSIKTNKWTDKEGKPRETKEIVAHSIQGLSRVEKDCVDYAKEILGAQEEPKENDVPF
jgi:single-strand DNA-binding protein